MINFPFIYLVNTYVFRLGHQLDNDQIMFQFIIIDFIHVITHVLTISSLISNFKIVIFFCRTSLINMNFTNKQNYLVNWRKEHPLAQQSGKTNIKIIQFYTFYNKAYFVKN